LAEAAGEATAWLKVILVADCAACVAGGMLLLLSLLAFLVVEGTQILVDEMGLAVEVSTLPGPLARRLGAGRLGWKQITHLEKGLVFFRLRGGGEGQMPLPGLKPPTLRFLVVDHLDRLIHLILERSPNLGFED
jgi:hypothetical protein